MQNSTNQFFGFWLTLTSLVVLIAPSAFASPGAKSSSQMNLVVKIQSQKFVLGKPIPISIRIFNKAKSDFEGDFRSPVVRFFVPKSDNIQLKASAGEPLGNEASHRFVPTILKPRQSVSTQIDVANYVTFKRPGTYFVSYVLVMSYWRANTSGSTTRKDSSVVKRGNVKIVII